MHLHILGIAGTFMGGIAQLAQAAGHEVTGADERIYPPMSHQLQQAGIEYREGFAPEQLRDEDPDIVVVGNVMSRGRPVVEEMLNRGWRYISGPQWLYENILQARWVLAVAGTHGKTSTASMLAWILDYAGLNPGFLIGGVPENFGVSARLGESPFFVIEADEYDTAFFDKRSKFVHYHPRTLVINNLEFDHADIFSSLADIQRQFHHLIRMVPGEGLVIHPDASPAIDEVLQQGCWTPTETLAEEQSSGWSYRAEQPDCAVITILFDGEACGTLRWKLLGHHNAMNALAACAAARHAGVAPEHAIAALAQFKGIKRRLELRGELRGIRVYDDFAHHPTAIATTLEGLRQSVGQARVVVAFEPRSNTMRQGIHREALAASFARADQLLVLQPAELPWDIAALDYPLETRFFSSVDSLRSALLEMARSGDHIVVMSNGGFGGLHEQLLTALQQ
jgi:UDP-N-acetylmuramate: L-alanyl-gamma-D-glutamyl-meso-diaminopimelate ligase